VKPRAINTPAGWLKANGVDLAPLTGTDARVLVAVATCWELYAVCGDDSRARVLVAVRELLHVMQPKTRGLTKMLIARAMDWEDVDRLWPQVSL
jgi:hypothetical protein